MSLSSIGTSSHIIHASKQLPAGSSTTARSLRTRMVSSGNNTGTSQLLHMYLSFQFLLATIFDNQLQSILGMVDQRKYVQASRLVDLRCRICDQQSHLDISVSTGGLENLFSGESFLNGTCIHGKYTIYCSACYWSQSFWFWG